MISHHHRCIFVHIPRTAGTSIEHWLAGGDWWSIDRKTKHLTAHQARSVYAEWWDDYFTFSIVRHPLDRLVSLAKFSVNGIRLRGDGILDVEEWARRRGDPPLEYDERFHSRHKTLRDCHAAGRLYANTLDEPLDYVARFENLPIAIEEIRANVAEPPDDLPPHLERSTLRQVGFWQYFGKSGMDAARMLHSDEPEHLGYQW